MASDILPQPYTKVARRLIKAPSRRVSCFAHTSTNNDATLEAYSVCYNIKLDSFSEFPQVIYYLDTEVQYRKDLKKGKKEMPF